jgi:hypothetical protein
MRASTLTMAHASTKRTSPEKAPAPVDLPQHREGAGFDAAVALVEIDVGFDLALVGGCEGGLDLGL